MYPAYAPGQTVRFPRGVTETWAHDGVLDAELHLKGYQMFRCDIKTGNKRGGVLLYVRDSITNRISPTVLLWRTWCWVGDLLIGVCYRSTNIAVVGSNNDGALRNVLKEVFAKHVLVMGDFNYADVDWQVGAACRPHNQSTLEFVQTIEDCFYNQHVLYPTRGSVIYLTLYYQGIQS